MWLRSSCSEGDLQLSGPPADASSQPVNVRALGGSLPWSWQVGGLFNLETLNSNLFFKIHGVPNQFIIKSCEHLAQVKNCVLDWSHLWSSLPPAPLPRTPQLCSVQHISEGAAGTCPLLGLPQAGHKLTQNAQVLVVPLDEL